MEKNQIKNLLFDLGGVIMDLKGERAVEALRRLGMADADEFLGLYGQRGPFLALEKGLITADEFNDEIRRIIGRDGISDARIADAFNQFLIGIPVERLKNLRSLRKSHRVYLLSNTNPIMWHSKIAEEFSKEGGSVEDYFDGIVTSFEEHLYKPEAAIFQRVLEKFGISPEETLFFDDSPANVEAAQKLGYRTVYVAPGKEFYDLYKQYFSNVL